MNIDTIKLLNNTLKIQDPIMKCNPSKIVLDMLCISNSTITILKTIQLLVTNNPTQRKK